MMCPKCGSVHSEVIDSRLSPNNSTRRRRWCKDCGIRFSTVEIIVEEHEATKEKLELLQTILKAVENECSKYNSKGA